MEIHLANIHAEAVDHAVEENVSAARGVILPSVKGMSLPPEYQEDKVIKADLVIKEEEIGPLRMLFCDICYLVPWHLHDHDVDDCPNIVCRECGVMGHGALTALCPLYKNPHQQQDSKSSISLAINSQKAETKSGGKRGIEPLSCGIGHRNNNSSQTGYAKRIRPSFSSLLPHEITASRSIVTAIAPGIPTFQPVITTSNTELKTSNPEDFTDCNQKDEDASRINSKTLSAVFNPKCYGKIKRYTKVLIPFVPESSVDLKDIIKAEIIEEQILCKYLKVKKQNCLIKPYHVSIYVDNEKINNKKQKLQLLHKHAQLKVFLTVHDKKDTNSKIVTPSTVGKDSIQNLPKACSIEKFAKLSADKQSPFLPGTSVGMNNVVNAEILKEQILCDHIKVKMQDSSIKPDNISIYVDNEDQKPHSLLHTAQASTVTEKQAADSELDTPSVGTKYTRSEGEAWRLRASSSAIHNPPKQPKRRRRNQRRRRQNGHPEPPCPQGITESEEMLQLSKLFGFAWTPGFIFSGSPASSITAATATTLFGSGVSTTVFGGTASPAVVAPRAPSAAFATPTGLFDTPLNATESRSIFTGTHSGTASIFGGSFGGGNCQRQYKTPESRYTDTAVVRAAAVPGFQFARPDCLFDIASGKVSSSSSTKTVDVDYTFSLPKVVSENLFSGALDWRPQKC